jgi:hypothetical protein
MGGLAHAPRNHSLRVSPRSLAASLDVPAAPRFWALADVRFGDGTVATGYFSYDDATQAIANWNVRVDGTSMFPAFTYVPGNAHASTAQAALAVPTTVELSARLGNQPGDASESGRRLQLTPSMPLDGSSAAVPLIAWRVGAEGVFLSREDFEGGDVTPPLSLWRPRFITGGSLVLMPAPPPVTIVNVEEFYHPGLRHYFITASDAEKQVLDVGFHAGWIRTGESFKAYAKGSSTGGPIHPVCRFYIPPTLVFDIGFEEPGADSHFFTADGIECVTVWRRFWFWNFEDDNAFQIGLPDRMTGACPPGTIAVYRLWNRRVDTNHRYTTNAATKAAMLADGYVAEGYGTDGVAMCAVQ